MSDRRKLLAFCCSFSDCRGAALVEFAVIAPLLVLLYLGTFEATTAVRAYMKVNAAAQSYADLIANQESITTTSLTNYCAGAKLALAGLNTSGLSLAAASVTADKTSGTPAQDWHDTTHCGTGIGSISGTTLAGTCPGSTCLVPNKSDSVIVVRASYAYVAFLHYILPASQTFAQTASARPRQDSTIDCSDCTQN